jgi:protein deglycase
MISGYITHEVIIMVYVLLAEGFEEIEAISTIDILRRGGVEVVTVSIGTHLQVTGAHRHTSSGDWGASH